MKWKKIDELEINKRRFLNDNDNVIYLREFTAGGGYSAGETNNLINNLQKGVSCTAAESHYRNRAIQTFSRELHHLLSHINNRSFITGMPPRQAYSDNNYDDRIVNVIENSISGLDNFIPVRIIENEETREELREQDVRNPNYLKRYLVVNDIDLEDIDDLIIVDDVITSGCSIRAVTEILEERYNDLNLWFIVWAKVIWNQNND